MPGTAFVVEQAGCPSCAERLRGALGTVATVDAIDVDEEADAAAVRLRHGGPLSEDVVAAVLRNAAAGSGHEYRVQPGSWRTLR